MAVKKEIKIAYFPSETPKLKVLNTNGKSLDHYCTKAVTEEDLSTGNYLLDATFLAAETKGILHEEAILKVRMDYGEEVFRISKVTKGTRYIDIVARQITIADSLTLFIRDARPTNLKGQAALTWIMDRAEGVKEIEITSNIDTSSTSYYLDKNLYEVLHTADNSFIDRWGGEIQRRAYTIKINDKIGVDRGFSIREGKNLTGFEGSSNIDSLVTRAKGKGFNGIEGNFIDSALINHYNRTYTSVIEYPDVKVKDEYSEDGFETEDEAKAELDKLIRNEFEVNHIDQIKASYSINFVQLEKTEEYKHYQVAERAFIGDTVRVYIPKHDIDVNVRVRRKKYDVLAQRTKEITLSNFIIVSPPTIKDVYDSLESIKSENLSSLQQAKEYASELIKSGLKNSYVIVREDEIVIGDTKDINTMVNVWRFNKNGLGFSSAGYYGEFGLAMTMNGAIVADFITTGVLTANIIRTGILKSENQASWINMENGTFSFANGALTYSIENGFEINGYATTNDLNQYPTKTDLSTSGKTVINGGNITTGFLSADRISGGFLTSKNNDLRFNLDEGRLGIYSNNTLLATALKMKENKSGKYGMGILANNSSFISLGLGDNDDNTVYKPYIALANRITGTEWDSGINLLTTVHGWFNHLKNFKLVWDGFKRSSNDSVVLYSTNQNSTDSKLIMELANDYKTSFEIVSKMYNSGEKTVASFRGTGGSEYNPEGNAGINFYQNLDMHGYRIWGAQTLNAMSLEIESDDAYVKAQSHISFATTEDFKVAKTQYISTSTQKSVNHIGSVIVENKAEYVELPNDFLMCVNVNVVATPNKLCKFAVTHVDEYGFIIECDETEVKFDYSVTAHKI